MSAGEGGTVRGDRALALESYQRRGVGILRGLVPAARVQALLGESERLWLAFEPRGPEDLRFGVRLGPSGELILERLDPVADVSSLFAAVNEEPGLVSLAEDGLRTAVTAMKEKLIYKWPGTPGFGLHRDGDYNTPRTGVPGREVMTVCIALDPVTPASGPTEFFPGLRDVRTPSTSGEPRDVDPSAVRGMRAWAPELAPGDAVIFDGLVPHRSGRNASERPRRVYMITYVPSRHARARQLYYAAREREQGEERRRLLRRSTAPSR